MKFTPRRVRCSNPQCNQLTPLKDIYPTKRGPVCKRCFESGYTWKTPPEKKDPHNKIRDE